MSAHRFGKLFRKKSIQHDETNQLLLNRVFGCDPKLVASKDGLSCPALYTTLAGFIIKYGIQTSGILRNNGDFNAVSFWRRCCEAGEVLDMRRLDGLMRNQSSNTAEFDVFVASSLIFAYLNSLPEPLVSNTVAELLLEEETPVVDCIAQLPEINRHMLGILLYVSHECLRYADVNKTSVESISTVYGPAITRVGSLRDDFLQNDPIAHVREKADRVRVLRTILASYRILLESNLIGTPQYEVDFVTAQSNSNRSLSSSPSNSRLLDALVVEEGSESPNHPSHLPYFFAHLNGAQACVLLEQAIYPVASYLLRLRTSGHVQKENYLLLSLSWKLPERIAHARVAYLKDRDKYSQLVADGGDGRVYDTMDLLIQRVNNARTTPRFLYPLIAKATTVPTMDSSRVMSMSSPAPTVLTVSSSKSGQLSPMLQSRSQSWSIYSAHSIGSDSLNHGSPSPVRTPSPSSTQTSGSSGNELRSASNPCLHSADMMRTTEVLTVPMAQRGPSLGRLIYTAPPEGSSATSYSTQNSEASNTTPHSNDSPTTLNGSGRISCSTGTHPINSTQGSLSTASIPADSLTSETDSTRPVLSRNNSSSTVSPSVKRAGSSNAASPGSTPRRLSSDMTVRQSPLRDNTERQRMQQLKQQHLEQQRAQQAASSLSSVATPATDSPRKRKRMCVICKVAPAAARATLRDGSQIIVCNACLQLSRQKRAQKQQQQQQQQQEPSS